MNKEQAIQDFWEGFGWDVFDENTVPDRASFPRLTYSLATSDFGTPVLVSASLWDRSTSWKNVTEMADVIDKALGLRGAIISSDDGPIRIKRGNPFAQRMADEDDAIRRIYLNIEVEYYRNY